MAFRAIQSFPRISIAHSLNELPNENGMFALELVWLESNRSDGWDLLTKLNEQFSIAFPLVWRHCQYASNIIIFRTFFLLRKVTDYVEAP